MKIGDLVRLKTNDWDESTAIITDTDPCGWFVVLQEDGRTCLWPKSQMEKINEV